MSPPCVFCVCVDVCILRLTLLTFSISFEPIGVVFDVIPFLGDVARLGTGLFAFSSGLVLTLIVVSVAWLFYRPRTQRSLVRSLWVCGGG